MMASSEWISMALSLVGFSFAFWVSWVFYRAQQKTDFRSLVEKLSELKADLVRMHEVADKYQKINEYGTHQSMLGVDKLNNTLSKHSTKLLNINNTVSRFQEEIEAVANAFTANLDLRESATRNTVSEGLDEIQRAVRNSANQLAPYQSTEDISG